MMGRTPTMKQSGFDVCLSSELELGTHLFLFALYTLAPWLLHNGCVLPCNPWVASIPCFLGADEALFGTKKPRGMTLHCLVLHIAHVQVLRWLRQTHVV